MKFAAIVLLSAISLSGCGKSESPREALEKLQQIPGYREARIFCTQCHKLPTSSQHVPAAWPGVVTRMENYARAENRKMPNEREREAIIGFFQANPN